MVSTSGPTPPATSPSSSKETSTDTNTSVEREAPGQGDVKRFNDSLERREQGQQEQNGRQSDEQSGEKGGDQGRDGKQQDRHKTGEAAGEPLSPMQLFGKTLPNQTVNPVQPSAAMTGESRIGELAQNLTSRILVGETNGIAEVRIQLNDAILPGTEVRIAERDGKLVAEFIISNADSANFLNQRQDDLAARLSKVLQKDVEVITIQDSGTGNNEGDPNRRSSQEYQRENDEEENDDGDVGL